MNGRYPVINSGRDFYGRYNECNNAGNAITIAARGEYAGFVKHIDEPFWAGGLCYPYSSKDESTVRTKFIYYYLKSIEQRIMDTLVAHGSIPAINKTDVDNIKIPIPSIEEQDRIINILNRFDELIGNISEGLPAEIEARKKQYAYYRDVLLTFEEAK